MPLAENALTTLESVKEYLKIPIGTTVDDSKLEDLINSCSTAIESYCGRKLKVQDFEEEYDGTGKKYILLEQYPVKSITSIKVDDALLDSTDYKVKKTNGMLIRTKSVWPEGDINVTVSYRAGLDEVPADLELACKHYVMSYFKTDVANFSTIFSDGFVFRPDAIPAQVKALIAPYKKVV